MAEEFLRTELLLGGSAMERLSRKKVAVFGIGGVGGYVCEALARSGIGALDIIDHDTVSVSNINRQIIALHSTVGQYKVDAAEKRLLDINPDIKICKHKCFYLPETAEQFNFSDYDYIVDAIDTVKSKLEIIERAKKNNVHIISAMGAGNKLDPTVFKISDISKTSVCPLARIIRKELKAKGIYHLKVVFSPEDPIKPKGELHDKANAENPQRRDTPGSAAFMPSVMGMIIASEVISDLNKE